MTSGLDWCLLGSMTTTATTYTLDRLAGEPGELLERLPDGSLLQVAHNDGITNIARLVHGATVWGQCFRFERQEHAARVEVVLDRIRNQPDAYRRWHL